MAEHLDGGDQPHARGWRARRELRPEGGHEGGTREVAARLAKAPEAISPALLLAADLRLRERRGELTPAALVRAAPRIRAAIASGEADLSHVRDVVSRLTKLRGQPSIEVPAGL